MASGVLRSGSIKNEEPDRAVVPPEVGPTPSLLLTRYAGWWRAPVLTHSGCELLLRVPLGFPRLRQDRGTAPSSRSMSLTASRRKQFASVPHRVYLLVSMPLVALSLATLALRDPPTGPRHARGRRWSAVSSVRSPSRTSLPWHTP